MPTTPVTQASEHKRVSAAEPNLKSKFVMEYYNNLVEDIQESIARVEAGGHLSHSVLFNEQTNKHEQEMQNLGENQTPASRRRREPPLASDFDLGKALLQDVP